MIKLPERVITLLNCLESCGYEAFVVGGCVRDSLLGRTPDDWDICTSAEPEAIRSCFSNFHIIDTGLKHGTLTVLVDKQPFEITTYRIDGSYSDGRHPDDISFTSRLEDDLARRDFTINAMAYHPDRGLVDRFGGMDDLKHRRICCVGNADRRFQEDGLRIMRALRFASLLDFQIEKTTSAALYSCRMLLRDISAERIRAEFDRLLCGSGAIKILSEYREILACIIPEIRPMFELNQKNPHHIYTVWDHTLHTVSHIKNLPALKLAAFFHDIGKPGSMTVDERGCGHFYKHEALGESITNKVMLRLKYDNDTRETVTSLIRNHGIVFIPASRQARRLLGKLGEERLRLLIELEYADVKSQNPVYTQERIANIRAFSQSVDRVLEADQCFSLRHLALNGSHLLSMGIPQGPDVGRILNALLDLVIEDRLPNEKEALMVAAKQLF